MSLKLLRVLAAAGLGIAILASAAHAEDPENTVVARVGGAEIRLAEVVAKVVSLPPQEQRQSSFEELYDQVLAQMIDEQILLNAAIDAGLRDTPEHAETMKRLEARVLRDTYLNRKVREAVTRDSMRALYDAMAADSEGREEIHGRHILVAEEEDAIALAAEIDGGADFAELARTRSRAPGAAEGGGDLGWFSRESMLPAIADAAFGLDVGEVSAPVRTQFGWHLVKVEDRREMTLPPYEEVEQQLVGQVAEEVVSELMESLRTATTVERFRRDGTPFEPAEGGE